MFSFPEFLNPSAYNPSGEASIVVIQAHLVAFVASLWVALLAYRSALRSQTSGFLGCAHFAVSYALWNLFFLSAYAQRDLQVGTANLSTEISARAYLIIGVLLPSLAHYCLKHFFPSQKLVSNQLHVYALLAVALLLILPKVQDQYLLALPFGIFAFLAMAWLCKRLWQHYRNTKDLQLKTRSFFLALGMTICVVLTLLGQLRADHLVAFPIPYFGNILTVAFIYFVYQMIQNPGLSEVRELMLRGIRVVFLTVVLSIIFLSLIAWIGEDNRELFIYNTFVASFIILIILDPLQKKIDDFILRKFIVDRYEFEKLILNLSEELRRTRTTHQLFATLLTTIRKADRVYQSGVFLYDPTLQRYRLSPNSNLRFRNTLPLDHPLLKYLRTNKVKTLRAQDSDPSINEFLSEFRAELIFPLYHSDHLHGVWIIRTSLSSTNPYTSFSKTEVDLLANLAQELANALEQLHYFEQQEQQQRFAALGEMSAALAHEIRNPLGAIQGAVQLLETSSNIKNEDDRECIKILSAELNRLHGTVNQYLQYARRSEEVVQVNIANALRKAAQSSKVKAENTKTEIHLEPLSQDFILRTDPMKLEQVLINLIQNACEAFSKNVWIRAFQNSSSQLEIQIEDDGPGVPPHILPNIFTPLFTTKRAGSGLGLPICKKIIDSLGGDLQVESTPQKGTCFFIRFPIGQTEQSKSENDLHKASKTVKKEG